MAIEGRNNVSRAVNVSHSAAFGVSLLHWGELVFAYAADGAYPVVGDVGE